MVCWMNWLSRQNFTKLKTRYGNLTNEEQRIVHLMASKFGDEGENAYIPLELKSWSLNNNDIEQKLLQLYKDWVRNYEYT